jgi:hypothetical protein
MTSTTQHTNYNSLLFLNHPLPPSFFYLNVVLSALRLLFSRKCYMLLPSPVHDPKNVLWTIGHTSYDTSHSVPFILLFHVSSERCLQYALLKHTHYNHFLALRWETKFYTHTHTHKHTRNQAENYCLCTKHNNTLLNDVGERYELSKCNSNHCL